MSHEAEIEVLKAQVAQLRRQMKFVSDWQNTVFSPWYKRLWWWCQGYRLSVPGTWYVAPWNRHAAEKYNKGL